MRRTNHARSAPFMELMRPMLIGEYLIALGDAAPPISTIYTLSRKLGIKVRVVPVPVVRKTFVIRLR